MATSHLNGDFVFLKKGKLSVQIKCHKTRSSPYNTSVINTKTNTTTNPLSPLGLPCILTFDSLTSVWSVPLVGSSTKAK